MVTHDEAANRIANVLRENDFFVRTRRSLPLGEFRGLEVYHALTEKKLEWTKIVDVLGLKMRIDGHGPLVRGKNGKRLDILGESIAVEVSNSSDVKREADRLRKVPVRLRLIVTTDLRTRGELSGIPVISYSKVDSAFISGLKEIFFCHWQDCDYFTPDWNELFSHEKKHEESELLNGQSPETRA